MQGVFRGLGEARTPLAATLGCNALNLALDPLLIFVLGWGVAGAAQATALAEVGAAAHAHSISSVKGRFQGMVCLSECLRRHRRPRGKTVSCTLARAPETCYHWAHELPFCLQTVSAVVISNLTPLC